MLADPRLNKGTAFGIDERERLGLVGLLPPTPLKLDEQVTRAYSQYVGQQSDLARHVMLTALQDRNEVLFYRLLADHLPEMLPVVYTPTVGEAIQRYSAEYRRPHGIYLSVDHPERIEASFDATGLGSGEVDLIVATDAGAILGIGDWGVGGMGIAVGKLTVYTAAGGIDPHRCIPVMLDVGTNRQELLEDPLYLGNRHHRVDRDTYDRFVDRYVEVARRRFPGAMLHWEDFATGDARRLLERYRDDLLTFNDDMQGTGAVNLAAVLSAVRATGIDLCDHRVVVFGAGTAGIGVADQLRDAMVSVGASGSDATARFWCVDRHGLLTDGSESLADFQRPFARPSAETAGWEHDPGIGGVPLAEVVRRVHPTVLIGTSAQPGAFSEPIVRDMAAHTDRPVILPMSNPTSLVEAQPADLVRWSGGRALVATGSPFGPVTYERTTYVIAQANNALIFPGLGLGVIAAGATRVTDHMLLAAAQAVSELVDPSTPGAPLLPQVADLRATSVTVAEAVWREADREGVATQPATGDLQAILEARMWRPEYRPIEAV